MSLLTIFNVLHFAICQLSFEFLLAQQDKIELWWVDNEVGIPLTNLPEYPLLAGYPDIFIAVFLTLRSGQSNIVEPIAYLLISHTLRL